MGRVKKINYALLCSIGASLFCNVTWARNLAQSIEGYERSLTNYVNQDLAIASAMRSRADETLDADERRVIERYYDEVRAYYLSPSIKKLTSIPIDDLVSEYAKSLNKLKSESDNSKRGDEKTRSYNTCITGLLRETRGGGDRAKGSMARIARTHQTSLRFNSSLSHLEQYQHDVSSLMTSLNGMKIRESDVLDCCQDNNMTFCEEKLQTLVDAETVLADALQRAMGDNVLVKAPNPLALDEEDLSTHDIRTIIEEKRSVLRKARQGAINDDYYSEQDVFASMDNCRKRAVAFQNRTIPPKAQGINTVGKLLKCSVVPLIATQNWDSDKAMIVNTLADAEIKGGNLDFTCDQGTGQMWQTIQDQGRDPVNWGIPQMANPPFLQSLRMVPPVSTGVNGITNAQDYMNLYPMPEVDNYDVSADAARTIGSVANAQSGIQLGGRTLSIKVSPAGASATQRGQGLALAARSASSNVRNGNQPEYFATRMARGAQNTRSFIETGVARAQALSMPKALEKAAQTAGRARDTVLRSVGTTASRTTSEGILNGLRGVSSQLLSVDTVSEQNSKIREAVKGQVQSFLDNIESVRVKAESTRAEIAALVTSYDQKVAELTHEIAGKAPKKIAEIIQAKRTELFEITKNLGIKKATYDGFQAAILEQNSALMRLATFGPTGTVNLVETNTGGVRGSVTGSSGSTSIGTASGVSGVDTSGMPAGRGNLQGATGAFNQKPKTGFEKLFRFLLPVPEAFASKTQSKDEAERFWNSEWKRFVKQYGDYVVSRRKEEDNIASQAAKLVASRNKSITLETYDFIDQGTLLTMDMYISELEEESQHLFDGHKTGQIRLAQPVATLVGQMRQDSIKAREAWVAAQREHLKIIPKTYMDDPELWWGFVPQIFIE